MAVEIESLESVRYFIKKGVNPNIQNERGLTAITLAIDLLVSNDIFKLLINGS